ncbi:peptidylprolyl isomerase [Neisseria elongata]|uniref:peptidylprolyl isomerase n=1 Tax=Neisseria elongata TaxID=495 RepID=UPI0024B1EF61|nr:peptidylprolyl isomerase [Neisseria elongata]
MNKTAKLLLAAAFAVSGLTAQAETLAEIDTNYGTIKLSLDEQRAPKTVANFVRYAEKGFYNNTVFHRVIDGFMIQGGGFTADLAPKSTNKAISNEAGNGLKNTAGTIAMARTGNPHSATSQFFINLADNDFLNHKDQSPQGYGYAVFGKVIGGMDVVRNIGKVSTTDQAIHQNVPVKPVIIRRVNILK